MQNGLKFDKKITIGNILTVIGMICSVFAMWFSLDKSLAVVTTKTEMIIGRVDRIENLLFRTNQYTLNQGAYRGQKTNFNTEN